MSAAGLYEHGLAEASFRGYADYMQTWTFTKNLNCHIEFAKRERVVLMCVEAVPWRCHRSLIADALLIRGIKVSEIGTGPHAVPLADAVGAVDWNSADVSGRGRASEAISALIVRGWAVAETTIR